MEKIIPAWVYRQYDADYTLEHPGQGYEGWKKINIPINPEHTAIVVMHAWDNGTPETHPALHRVCEYMSRGKQIIDEKFPDFLAKVRAKGFNIIHVGSLSEYSLEKLPGYIRTKELCPVKPFPHVDVDETIVKLRQIHTQEAMYGHNTEEVNRLCSVRDFAIMPPDDEDVACTSEQLYTLCKKRGINHLIYTGFAVNMCLTASPCGIVDMGRYGMMRSVIRDLTTGVENKESCAEERHKEYGLWYYSILGGFVFEQKDVEDVLLK